MRLMGNEFLAAIVGAVVGGVFASITAGIIMWITLRHENSKEEKRELDRKLALGRSLIFKLMRISSDLYRINEYLRESAEKADSKMRHEPWAYVLPISNLPDTIKILPEEVALIMQKENDETVNSLLNLEYIHKSALSILKSYAELREEFSEEMPITYFDSLESNHRTTGYTNDEYLKLRPKMISLNLMIESLKSRSQTDSDLAWKTLEEVNRVLSDKIDLKLKLKLCTSEEGNTT